MRIETPTAQLLQETAAMATAPGIGMSSAQIENEIAAGRLQPQWSQVALDDADRVIGRALWWARDQQTPIELDVWDVIAEHAEAAKVLRALLERGHSVLAARGIPVPLPHTMRVPVAWRDDAVVVHDVHTKIAEAASIGLGYHNERRQFEWGQGTSAISPSPRLRFEPADDDTFISLFARAAHGSLDVMTRRELATTDALSLARDEVDYYRSCPGDRDWWRLAYDEHSSVVGIAIPSATPTNRNVGYLAVLPERRGHGYVDDLLGFITAFHAASGAERITATTDAVNTPMAAAFERAGYRCIETRIDLER
ncbi:GNAT family N-acetyltransferase [Kocuria palustris]|jgi:GNAT superfamily N-acetyltransferase|uniref:GNAT family N-acetyltransferase n=1 Tax=Kocuria palustris TaxID=71999 RepID=UPI0019D04ED8|nr:GNAT family N-acetyltransferase [Kocuria palustris]MBN6752389.1 GNAT family N-acetyltransferase [Kocuria palustris]MBN6757344.1 GNAT family N-acetyltransferase [Kocuria palustris]MBN6762372.1 GNAT family N-acetyltransferase [Kocuria palustris]MBN6781854.1 GNAT family N-acetyltransferase [Kocuria palustris]MBN6798338.1 GNAT family N-acetyltransferase [Kocuria palustris]